MIEGDVLGGLQPRLALGIPPIHWNSQYNKHGQIISGLVWIGLKPNRGRIVAVAPYSRITL